MMGHSRDIPIAASPDSPQPSLASTTANLEPGQSVATVIQTGAPIAIPVPIAGCPVGLESLWLQKNFYFEEVQLGFIERDQDSRFSYNLYVSDGSRIYFIANTPTSHEIVSWRYFTYEILISSEEPPVLVLEGNQYGSVWDVCAACCVCNAHRGIKVMFDGTEIGWFEPVHKQVMPCIFSCTSCCFCYIDKYVIHFHDGPHSHTTRRFFTRKPKVKRKKNDYGLEVIDPGNGNTLVAKVSNCIISGKLKKRVLPVELQSLSLLGDGGVKVQFALSLADSYVHLHPYGKVVLLALAIFHESEVMSSQRSACKDNVGFVDA